MDSVNLLTNPRKKGWIRRKVSAAQWNELCPIGTAVRYFPVEGFEESRVSCTRSEAWETLNGTVVQIRFQAGYVMVSHLQVLVAEPVEVDRLMAEAGRRNQMQTLAHAIKQAIRSAEDVAHDLQNGKLCSDGLLAAIDKLQAASLDLDALKAVTCG